MSPFRRLWNVLRRGRIDDELRQEFDTHLALIEEEERAHGLTAEHAQQRARMRFGNPLSYREQTLDAIIATWLENVGKDVRHAVRILRTHPGFTTVAVLSLALGIGVSTAMFSVINAVLLRALPYPNPAQLVRVIQRDGGPDVTVSEYEVAKEQTRVFSSIAAYRDAGERRLGSGTCPYLKVDCILSVSSTALITGWRWAVCATEGMTPTRSGAVGVGLTEHVPAVRQLAQ